MTTASTPPAEQWLKQICRCVSNPDYRLEYEPFGRISTRSSELSVQESVGWEAKVHGPGRLLGHLRLRVDQGSLNQPAFLENCQLAETILRAAESMATSQNSSVWEPENHQSLQFSEELIDRNQQEVTSEFVERTFEQIFDLTTYRGVALYKADEQQKIWTRDHYLQRSLEPMPVHPHSTENGCLESTIADQTYLVCRQQNSSEARWLPENVKTAFCFNIKVNDQHWGCVWIYDRRHRLPQDREFHVVQSLLNQMAQQLEVLQLKSTGQDHERLNSVLRIASDIQPEEDIKFESDDHQWNLFSRCTSCHEVGGDLCEVIPLEDNRLLIVIGDASGNHVPAAMVMTATRGAIHSLVSDQASIGDPAELMERLNLMLCKISGPFQFMTCLCAVVDLSSGALTYCNAGHPLPILIRDHEPQYLESHGVFLGIEEQYGYHSSTVLLHPDDRFILYTDGISEAMNQAQRLFRDDGIVSAALPVIDQSAEQILESIWHQMEMHTDQSSHRDDATALVLARR